MANTILSGLLSRGAARIVNATTGSSVCPNLKVIDIIINMSATVFKHKMEDGRIKCDGRVVNPSSIEISAFIPDLITLDAVNKLLTDRESYYNLVIKDTIWMTLVCENEGAEQSAAVINATPVTITFKEIIKAVTFDKPAEQAADGPNRQRGDIQPQNTTMTVEQHNQQVLERM